MGKRNDTISIFVGFVSGDDAEKALQVKEVLGEIVKPLYAKSPIVRRTPYFSRTRLHATGIGNLQEEELSKMLGNCSLIFPKRSEGKSPYLFAQYQNEEEKKAAIDALDGKKVDGENVLRLSPAYA